MPQLELGQDRRQDDERGARSAEENANHRPPKRRGLLAAFAEAQRHRHHPGHHRETGHQDRTQTAPCAFYRCLPWFAALEPAALKDRPKLVEALTKAGLSSGEQPGVWVKHSGGTLMAQVDLLVRGLEHCGPANRRPPAASLGNAQ